MGEHDEAVGLVEAVASLSGTVDAADRYRLTHAVLTGDEIEHLRTVLAALSRLQSPAPSTAAKLVEALGDLLDGVEELTDKTGNHLAFTVSHDAYHRIERVGEQAAAEIARLTARLAKVEAQVRVAYGFDRDAVFANIDTLTAERDEARRERDEAVSRDNAWFWKDHATALSKSLEAAEDQLAAARARVEELEGAVKCALDFIDHGCWIAPASPAKAAAVKQLRQALTPSPASMDQQEGREDG